jgi:hypothetical protein
MALWTASDFKSKFNCSQLSDAVVTDVLTDAEYEVENYITAAAYADAILVSPTDDRAKAKIVRITGYLAYFYLQQQKLLGGERTKHTEKYAGVKSYSDSYDTKAVGRVFTSEADILLELWEWKQAVTTTFDPIVAGGTGRWVGTTTTDDDE